MTTLLLILLLYFFSFALLFYLVLSKFLRPKAILEEQLAFYRDAWEKFYGRSLARPRIGIGAHAFAWALSRIGQISRQSAAARALEKKLDGSGLSINTAKFIFYHFLAVLAVGTFGFLALGILGILIFVLITAFLPIFYLDYKAGRRQAQLGEQLPELLTSVAGLLKVGHGFYQSIDSAVKEMSPPISDEFKKVLTEARLGISFERALEDMAKRVQNPDYDWLVMAVKIQRETGGNLSEILDMLAKAIRDRERLQRQIKTLTAEGRLSAYILIALPIVITIVLYVINPGYIGYLLNTATGLFMLGIAVILMIIGSLWLRSIVRIKF